MEPTPDDKDWTWTLTRRCEQCGLSAGEVPPENIAERIFVAAEEWVQILRSSPAVSSRPKGDVWSPLEYGAHVRDVLWLFDFRLGLMLTEDDPVFQNWDQDATAIEARYGEQDPDIVAEELEAAAQAVVVRIANIEPGQLGRKGTRSNGDVFTVTTLLQYLLHDVVHHLWDVTGQQDAAASLALG